MPTTSDPRWSRRRLLLASAAGVSSAAALAVPMLRRVGTDGRNPPFAWPPPLAIWRWGRSTPLDAADTAALRSAGAELLALQGTIGHGSDGWTWTAMGAGSLHGMPAHAVVRLDGDAVRALGGGTAGLVDALARRAVAGRGFGGLQLDADVPSRRLDRYAALLRELRPRLPAGWRLSATMLLDWTRAAALDAVLDACDWVVPQCYTLDAPARPGDTRVGGGDIAALSAAMERRGRPWRLGLATTAVTAHFDAAGRRIAASVPVDLETALAAGGRVERIDRGDELRLHLRFVAPAIAGALRVDAGELLVIAMPTAAGLAAQLAQLRAAAPRRCGGVCLFRLAAPGAPALSPRQIAAALAGAPRGPLLDAALVGDGHERRLEIVNRSDEDWCDPLAPAVLDLRADGGSVRCDTWPEPGWRATPTRGGAAAAALRADGLRVEIGLVRAGARLTIGPVAIDAPRGIAGTLRQGASGAALRVEASP